VRRGHAPVVGRPIEPRPVFLADAVTAGLSEEPARRYARAHVTAEPDLLLDAGEPGSLFDSYEAAP
jgi:hypothetical protein